MKPLSIRVRLMAWYGLFLAMSLVVFAVLAALMMRHSINETVDEELKHGARVVATMIARTWPGGGGSSDPTLDDQARIRSQLQAGLSLLQVSDERGAFIYRSPRIKELGVPATQAGSPAFQTAQFGAVPLRVYRTGVAINGRPFVIVVAQDMDEYVEATARYEALLLIGIPALLAAGALGGYWMARRALAPVDEIMRAAQNISPHDLTSRLALPGTHDELEALATTLNSMLERIESAFKRITRFTADASHELRTPVSLIRTRAEIALRKIRSDEEYRETLHEILKESEHVSALIEDLMSLARSGTGAEALRFTRVELCELVRRVCAQGQTLAESRNIEWSQTIPPSEVWVEADPDAVRRLLVILIDNAVKYTAEHGSVRVLMSNSGADACVEVQDSGIGIAEADLPHIFERFYRTDSARSRDSGGAGLGLAIADWIAKAHHGEITAKSELARGSSFCLRLPCLD